MTLKEDGFTGEIEAIAPFDNELNMILAHLVQELSRKNQIEAKRNKMLNDFFYEFLRIFRERE